MKKIFGFTLMEMALAVLIVAILAAICFPVLSNREDKEKAYYYYLAYRTVEKMANQLLVKTDTASYTNPKFAFFMPKAFAVLSDSEFGAAKCSSSLGYYNMEYSGGECVCSNSSYEISTNNDKVCCPKATSTTRYYSTTAGTCVGCTVPKDFNESGGYCCPVNSYYDGSGNCICMPGYKQNGSGNSMTCTLNKSNSNIDKYCPVGYKYSQNVNNGNGGCVLNFILSPKEFCENISNKMNIDPAKTNCNTYTEVQKVDYNKATPSASAPADYTDDGAAGSKIKGYFYVAAYNAAVGTDNIYLSLAAKPGAFNEVTPNIIFANGLKLWIPQQKSASIPGLSIAPEDIQNDKEVTSCYEDTNKTSATSCGQNWCEKDGKCYMASFKTLALLTSAQACCSSPDIDWSKIETSEGISETAENSADKNITFAKSGFTVFVDINGDKGTGTLWDDVFPFYICNDGIVYPGYSFGNGSEPSNKKVNGKLVRMSLHNAGDNPTMLPTDVYYFQTTSSGTKPVTAYSGISFARAACLSGKVSAYAPYCLNLSFKAKGMTSFKETDIPNTAEGKETYAKEIIAKFKENNPCKTKACFISVRRKAGLF